MGVCIKATSCGSAYHGTGDLRVSHNAPLVGLREESAEFMKRTDHATSEFVTDLDGLCIMCLLVTWTVGAV